MSTTVPAMIIGSACTAGIISATVDMMEVLKRRPLMMPKPFKYRKKLMSTQYTGPMTSPAKGMRVRRSAKAAKKIIATIAKALKR